MSTIYAAALNFAGAYAELEPAMTAAPYYAPPQAPVLYIKPALCRTAAGAPIPCPVDTPALRMGGTLAVIIGRTARRVSAANALSYVGGYAVANDVSVPHASFYRPAVSQRCRDGFCPIGQPVDVSHAPEKFSPDALSIRIFVNGQLTCEANTSTLRRSVADLLAEVSDFITLQPGDILLMGEPGGAPLASPKDSVRVEIDGLDGITNPVVQEGIA